MAITIVTEWEPVRNGSAVELELGLNVTNESSSMVDMSNSSENAGRYLSSLGVWLAVPEWEAALTAVTLSLIIVMTVVGNILVILSVFTYRPLRSAPNFFIVSLAVADLTVAVLVLPLNVAYTILGKWVLGKIICEFWVTSDVLCCTASILHLCAIALDRYRAITDPVNYARKRTLHRVLFTIGVVWIMSFLISSPPILGWNDWPADFDENTPCGLTSQQGYVIYSALGSFFIPLVLMTAVYIRIFIATRRRLRQRARASRLSAMQRVKNSNECTNSNRRHEPDRDRSSISSIENNGNGGGEGGGDTEVSSKTADSQSRRKERRSKHGSSSSRGRQETGNNHTSSHNSSSDHGMLRVRIQCQDNPTSKSAEESEAQNKSPANASEESVTDVEVTSQLRPPSVRPDAQSRSHSTSSSSRASKKSSRQTSQQVSQFVEEKQRISLSKERKAARTLGIIMGVFVVCWLPFFIMYVILPFCDTCNPSNKVVNFITWLGYLNSSLNPIIYTIFNMDFRKAFKKLLHMGK